MFLHLRQWHRCNAYRPATSEVYAWWFMLKAHCVTVQILQPLQRVQLIVWAYPYGPDMLSLMSVAARTDAIDSVAAPEDVGVTAGSLTTPANSQRPAARSAGRTGLRGQAAEPEGLDLCIRNLMVPDHSEWRAALHQPLRVLRKEA